MPVKRGEKVIVSRLVSSEDVDKAANYGSYILILSWG